ncbi:hypothetical protein JVU11DRAFT_7988 [Chiua virens]|nr:hypothetical protein JVU11DRAFT_7988 [Chiua virens]
MAMLSSHALYCQRPVRSSTSCCTMSSSSNIDSSQGLPPLVSDGVNASFASITIDAPRDVVWRVLMDWGSYHECSQPLSRFLALARTWSFILYTFRPRLIIRSCSPQLPPSLSSLPSILTITAWHGRAVSYPSWVFSAVRWQALTEVVEDGKKKTRYETVEALGGFMTYLVKLVLASELRKGITAMMEALKKRSEEQTASCSCHLQEPVDVCAKS